VTDLLIRGLTAASVRRIDEEARRCRLSRTEFLRRDLTRRFGAEESEVTSEDWDRFDADFADLADPAVMDAAWQ
jgi:hypothetical protein